MCTSEEENKKERRERTKKIVGVIHLVLANILFITAVVLFFRGLWKEEYVGILDNILASVAILLSLTPAIMKTIPKWKNFEGTYATGSHLETTVTFSENKATAITEEKTDYGGIPKWISFLFWMIIYADSYLYAGIIITIVEFFKSKIKNKIKPKEKKESKHPKLETALGIIMGIILFAYGIPVGLTLVAFPIVILSM